jgi:pseudouridine-5'-phosphate glycosidase
MARDLSIHPDVEKALQAGKPVVALESTIISHGLPRPRNYEAAKEFEQILKDQSVVPATIAVINGTPTVGLSEDELQLIANQDIPKASVRDLAILSAKQISGATTVAATAHIAARAGVQVFATGGLGGVHKGALETFDESADITTLANTPIAVVSAGVKSVLDIAATLERLETLSISVVGYKTKVFPSFWLPESDFTLDWQADSAEEIASIIKAQKNQGSNSALVVANPVPKDQAWDKQEHDQVLAKAFQAAEQAGVRGKAVTPFLLQYIVEASGGRSLEVNLNLAKNNVRLAGEIARALA